MSIKYWILYIYVRFNFLISSSNGALENMTNYKSEIMTNTDYDIMFYPLPVYIKLSDNLLVQLD